MWSEDMDPSVTLRSRVTRSCVKTKGEVLHGQGQAGSQLVVGGMFWLQVTGNDWGWVSSGEEQAASLGFARECGLAAWDF